MESTENRDAFFESQFQSAKRLYDQNDEEYENACLRLLADPALSLHKRVMCCYMIARRFEHHRFYTQQGFETLNKIQTLVEEGRVADRLLPWISSTRTRFEDLQSEIETALEEYEAGESTEEEIEDGAEQELADDEKIEITEADSETASTAGGYEGSSSIQPSQDASTLQSVPQRTISTELTSIAAEPVERATSPPLHPAVQQMEDDADILFGDHTSYEAMTPEQQAAWMAAAPERLRKRLQEEEEDGEEEHTAKK